MALLPAMLSTTSTRNFVTVHVENIYIPNRLLHVCHEQLPAGHQNALRSLSGSHDRGTQHIRASAACLLWMYPHVMCVLLSLFEIDIIKPGYVSGSPFASSLRTPQRAAAITRMERYGCSAALGPSADHPLAQCRDDNVIQRTRHIAPATLSTRAEYINDRPVPEILPEDSWIHPSLANQPYPHSA